MLDASLKEQVRSIFSGLKADYTFDMEVAPQHESRGELDEQLDELATAFVLRPDRLPRAPGRRVALFAAEERRADRDLVPGRADRS